MAVNEDDARELARFRHGIIGWAEVRALGFSTRSIHARIDRGSWSRIGRALVIRDLHIPGDVSTAWALHIHAGPDSGVSGPAAARLQGWNIVGSDRLLLSPGPVRAPDGWDVTVIRRQRPELVRPHGLPPLAPRLDALTDTLLCRSDRGARELLDYVLQQRWIDADDLASLIEKRSGRGRKGISRLRLLHERAASGSRSEAEQRMGRLLARTAGNWICNYPVLGERVQAFLADHRHGITYRPNTWHHELTVFDAPARFNIFMWRDQSSDDEEFCAVPPFLVTGS